MHRGLWDVTRHNGPNPTPLDLITVTLFKWRQFARDKIIEFHGSKQNDFFLTYLNMPAIKSADKVIKPFRVTFYEPKMYLLFRDPWKIMTLKTSCSFIDY